MVVHRRITLWIGAAAFVLAAISAAMYVRPAKNAAPSRRFAVPLPDELARSAAVLSGISLSPDGLHLAYVAGVRERQDLWLRAFDSGTAQRLPGTEGATFPFWSPDGQSIGFFARGKLRVISRSGGPARVLADAPNGRGGSWNRAGVILYAPDVATPLARVSDRGGPSQRATTLAITMSETSHRWPHFFADGRHFLYVIERHGMPDGPLVLGSLTSNEKTVLWSSVSNAAYAQGYLVFASEHHTLLAQAFDVKTLRPFGDPFELGATVRMSGAADRAEFSVSDTGVLVYAAGEGPIKALRWVDREGKPLGDAASPGRYGAVSLAADPRLAAVDLPGPGTGRNIWVLDLERKTSTRLTYGELRNDTPVWSPGDEWLVFRSGTRRLTRKLSTGRGLEDLFFRPSRVGLTPSDWSPDGKLILCTSEEDDQADLWVVSLSGETATATPVLQTPFIEGAPRFSPDGKWVAYHSDESGQFEVYVRTFPVSDAKWRLSPAGGVAPKWRGDGRELFYMAPDATIVAVRVSPGAPVQAGPPSMLFQAPAGTSFEVTRDGQRLLLVSPVDGGSVSLVAVIDWTASLPR